MPGDGAGQSPYQPTPGYPTWGIKARILALPIGNQISMLSLAGVEYGFHNNQSVGIDGILNYTFGSHEDVYDTSGIKHDVGAYYHSTEAGAFLNYRYYLNFASLRENNGIALYTGPYLRYSHISYYKDQAYVADYFSKMEKQYAAGMVIGGLFQEKNGKHFGIDITTGTFYKLKDINTTYNEQNIIKTKNEKPGHWGYKLDINLYWWFFRKLVQKPEAK